MNPEEEQKQKHICRMIENIPECADLELTNYQPEATHVLVENTLKTFSIVKGEGDADEAECSAFQFLKKKN